MNDAPPPHPNRRHVPACLNCGAETPGAYCSVCGQEATDYRVSARLFFRELLDALTLDSKFFRSLGPLLFRPGFLTREFTQGRRVRYLRPLRLYLFTSFLFFVAAGLLLEQRVGRVDPASLADGFVNITFNTDSLGIPTESDVRETLMGAGEAFEDFPATQEQMLATVAREAIEEGMPDTTAVRLVAEVRAAFADSAVARAERETTRLREKAIGADSLAATAIIPPPEAEAERSFVDELLRSMTEGGNIRIGTGEGEIHPRTLLRGFIGNLPALMFFMVPFFALTLKLLYIRRKRLYLEHLVFGFHTHAFLFLLIGLALVVPFVPGFVSVIGAFVYLMVAARRVYEQGWWKTYVKVNILLTIYTIVLLIGFAITFAFSVFFARMTSEGRTILDLFS